MEPSTIKKINQLNQDFYQQVAVSFNQTRQYSWQGWNKLLPYLSKLKQPVKVLDIGCGNARFARFLSDKAVRFSYCGIDSNASLLDKAKLALNKLNIEHQLKNVDVVEAFLNKSFTTKIAQKYDLIVAFGLLHHLPSYQLRQSFFESLGELLSGSDSLAVVAAWQFAADNRFQQKIIPPSKTGLSDNQLETNDYILDWQNHPAAFRYCHFVDDEEVNRLSQSFINLKIIDDYLADGKSNQLNRYLIFSKK